MFGLAPGTHYGEHKPSLVKRSAFEAFLFTTKMAAPHVEPSIFKLMAKAAILVHRHIDATPSQFISAHCSVFTFVRQLSAKPRFLALIGSIKLRPKALLSVC